jgi:hypothetical protein|tara:strand:- start:224 stop:562 length:339 start_codon:yes stop_codon:yes gene_type:complete
MEIPKITEIIRNSVRKTLIERKRNSPKEVESVDVDVSHHNEESTLIMHEINELNSKVQYLTSINGDLVEFLHTLVKSLDHNTEIDISDARKDFTVLLNRSGRRKFYQQQKRL